MDLQQIWELAQRLLAEGRSRAEVEQRVGELTQQATGQPITIGQLETMVLPPGVGALRKTLRGLLAVPAVVRAAPKLIVRGIQEAWDLPERVVEYLTENEPGAVAEDLVSGVGAAAEFLKHDLEEFGPGGLLEGVGPVGRAGKVFSTAEIAARKAAEVAGRGKRLKGRGLPIARGEADETVRLERFTREEDPFSRTGIPGAEDRRRANDALGFRERLNFNVVGTGNPERVVAALPNRAEFDIPRSRLYPLAEDPDGIIAAVRKERGNVMGSHWTEVERKIQDAGYAGALEGDVGSLNQRGYVFTESLPELERIPGNEALEIVQIRRGAGGGGMFAEGMAGGAERALARAGEIEGMTAKELSDGLLKRMQRDKTFDGETIWQIVDDVEEARYVLPDGRPVGDPLGELQGHELESMADALGDDPRALGLMRVHASKSRIGNFISLDINQPPTAAQRRWIGKATKEMPESQVNVELPGGELEIARGDERSTIRRIGEAFDEIADVAPTGEVAAPRGMTQEQFAAAQERTALRKSNEAQAAAIQAENRTAKSIADLTDEFGGSTVDPRTGRSLVNEDRWAASIGPDFEQVFDKPLTETGVQQFIAKHQTYLDENPDVMVGTWFDEENRRWEINLTKTFESQRDARNFGAANKQRAIMNLADPEFEAVKVGDSFANARLRMRLDNTLDHRREARLRNFRNALDEGELKVWDGMSQDMKQGSLDVYSLMPEVEEGAALALVGAEAARWYQESARPLFEMFGTDAPRFLAMTAALSPNAPVDKAFWAGLDMWADWVQAGRPKNREWVEQTLGRLKKEYGVTPTNTNNLERVLNVSDADLLEPGALARGGIFGKHPIGPGLGTKGATTFLSGMKIDPFWGNLNGQLQRYVMDTHMKSATGFTAQASATKRQVIGATASARDQAKFLTELTGNPWTVAETQAAQWAVIKNIKEMALEGVAVGQRGGQTKKVPRMLKELTGIPEGLLWTDEVPATEFGELSQRIRNTPSLQRYLHADEAKPHLARIGIEPPPLSEQLSKLDFLDDPRVRFGDVMDAMIRIAQTNGQSLPAVAAMLISQGVINQVQGRELLDAIGKVSGVDNLSKAAEIDPEATTDALQLLDENPEVDDETMEMLGEVRGRPGMKNVVRLLRGGSQSAERTAEDVEENAAGLRDTLTTIAGGGRFRVSRVPDVLDKLMPKEAGTQTAGIVFDLPFLRGTANIDPDFAENRDILAHEGGHVLENVAPHEAAGINAALDQFISGLSPARREALGGEVVNRPPTDEAMREELFANLFKEELLKPGTPSSVEGTDNVRQLFRQMIDRRLNFPGIGE